MDFLKKNINSTTPVIIYDKCSVNNVTSADNCLTSLKIFKEKIPIIKVFMKLYKEINRNYR